MNLTNLHIQASAFKNSSRILRETKSIIDKTNVNKVIIIASWEEAQKLNESIDEKREIHRFKLFFDKFRKNPLTTIFRYIEITFRVLKAYKHINLYAINCHSLLVLPLGLLLKKTVRNKNALLIYDAHELESKKAGLKKIAQFFSYQLERILIKYVDKVIVVSPSIGLWYEKTYKLNNVIVIRNTPERFDMTQKKDVFRTKFNIPKNHQIFLYQGVINKGRGIEILIHTFEQLSREKHLVVMGYGPLTHLIKQASLTNSNIHYMPAVMPSEIQLYTTAADVGLSIIENISLSYYYCLPNKLFEYLHSGLPVITSNFPDMANIINTYECGWCTEVSSLKLKEVINSITLTEMEQKNKGVIKANSEINWEKESEKIIHVFNNNHG